MKNSKLMAVFTLLVLPVLGSSAAYDSKKHIDLLLPEKQISQLSQIEPVPYKAQPPGEFVDVDLPDDLKKVKQIHLAEVSQNESAVLNKVKQKNTVLSIQIAVFKNKKNAIRLKEKLLLQHLRVFMVEKYNHKNDLRYHVRLGQYTSRLQAKKALINFRNTVDTNAFIVTE